MPRFEKGNHAHQGRGGRPPGSRNKLCRRVLEDLLVDWAEGGAAAIKMMRIERPAEYVRVMCSILPKELIFENSAVTELDDDELDHMISDVARASPGPLGRSRRLKRPRNQSAAEWTTLTSSMQPASGSKVRRARRLAERIEAGELVEVPLYVVAGSESEASAKVEQAKADALAELRATGDQREVKFTVELIVTGVLRPGEATGEPWKPAPRPVLPSPVAAPSAPDEEVREEPQRPVIETYVQVQVRACRDDDDAGEIAEGWFSIDGKVLTVTDAKGKYVGSRAMLEGEDARVVAKQLLRGKKAPEEEFNRPLSYPNMGLA